MSITDFLLLLLPVDGVGGKGLFVTVIIVEKKEREQSACILYSFQ